MKYKKIMLLAICLVSLLAVSAVSAEENATEDIIADVASEDVVSVENNNQTIEQTENEDTIGATDDGTFTALQEKIDNAEEGSTITLENDYTYDEGFSTGGISIWAKVLTIDGNNHTIDAKSKSRIFYINYLNSENIILKNIIFKGGSSSKGSAIYNGGVNCSIVSCDFVNCYADGAGAIYNNADNCIVSSCNFTNCHASDHGGAIDMDACENCSISYCNFIKCYTAKINTTIDGAIYINDCNVTVKNCTFNDSDASNPIATVIVSSPVTTVFNGNKYLIATLKDIDGNALSGFEVSVDLNGVKILPTDENGQVKVSTNGLTPKTYDVAITFAGNENYTESNTTTKVVINKDSTKLSASAVATVFNVYKKPVITVKDSQGRALNVVKVSVNINGKTYTTMDVLVKIPFGRLVPKTYTAKISFAGDRNYKASSTTVNVTVKKATPKLTAAKKTFKKSVKTKKFTVTLKNNLNEPMESTLVTLKVNGKTYKATTNYKGQATFKITKLTKKGKYTATVTYKGSSYYNKVTKKVKITVK